MIKVILGFSVALISGYAILAAAFLAGREFFEDRRMPISISIGVAGVLVLVIALIRAARNRGERTEAGCEKFLPSKLLFWGPMLMILGSMTLFIQPLSYYKKKRPAAIFAQVKADTPEVTPPVKPAKFPEVKVQGVILEKGRSVVIVNGQSYAVGDQIGEAVVKTIDRNGIELELSGAVTWLDLP